jgi:hypothetical protein
LSKARENIPSQKPSLFFRPQRFVNETEIEHSRIILQELLEIIINENLIDLIVSEIEGADEDAHRPKIGRVLSDFIASVKILSLKLRPTMNRITILRLVAYLLYRNRCND